jgi:hypothetical protein
MSKPTKISEVVGEFTLYDVPTICRGCQVEFIGKAFKPADGAKRFGWCASCQAIEDAPKLPHKPDLDLRPPRRVFGEDDE